MLRAVLHVIAALGVLVGSVVIAVERGETPVESNAIAATVVEAGELGGEPASTIGARPANEAWIGVIVPLEEVEVAAPIDARIETVHVRLGDSVERDQVLVTIDRRELDEDLAAARANLLALQAGHAEAAVEFERADDTHRRTRALGDVIAEQERVDAEFGSKIADAGLDRAAAAIVEQRALIAKLQAARLDTDVRAPFAGTVSLRHVDGGAFTTEGAPLIELVSRGRILRLAATSTASVGQRLGVVCGEGNVRFAAVVERVAPQRDVSSGTTLVEARLEGESEVAIGETCAAGPE